MSFVFSITRSVANRCHSVTLAWACLVISVTTLHGQDSDLPKTIAETSNYKATSRSAEVEQLIRAYDAHADHVSSFQFGTTVEGRPMTAALVANPSYDVTEPDSRVVAMLLGNIHSGECAGKEALLKMLRELSENEDHPWLANMVIVFVPNYNADANDDMAIDNRPGQVGPENGMGRRANSQQKDLNRDFVKLESNEAQALIGLIDQWNPHLFVDCHTTNGSRHRYCLTYDIPHNPTAPQDVTSYMRDKMMPRVTDAARDSGKDMFYYGNFNRDRTRWTTYGYEPRYSTEYIGIRGRLGVLSEAYSYISYQERIEATEVFVAACLDYVSAHHLEIIDLLKKSEAEFVKAASGTERDQRDLLLTQSAEIAAFDEPFTILGFDEEEPADIEVEFFGRYIPVKSRSLPYAYLLPEAFADQIERLQMHGIQVARLTENTTMDVEFAKCRDFTKSPRAFQGHQMARFTGEIRHEEAELPKGTYVVFTGQPLGRLVGYMLDPQSGDGLTTWNFFDSAVEVDKDHPVMALPAPIDLPIENVPYNKD